MRNDTVLPLRCGIGVGNGNRYSAGHFEGSLSDHNCDNGLGGGGVLEYEIALKLHKGLDRKALRFSFSWAHRPQDLYLAATSHGSSAVIWIK